LVLEKDMFGGKKKRSNTVYPQNAVNDSTLQKCNCSENLWSASRN